MSVPSRRLRMLVRFGLAPVLLALGLAGPVAAGLAGPAIAGSPSAGPAAGSPSAGPAGSASAAGFAGGFGTGPVSGPGRVVAPAAGPVFVSAVSVGRHAGFDRVVFRATGGLPPWQVRYVPSVSQDGSGAPVPLLGAADVLVVLQGTSWTTTPSAQPTLTPGFPGLRQVRGAGEFEATLSYGIGQATKAGIRVFALTAPDRLVVDVRHPASAAPTTPPAGSGTAGPGTSAPGPTGTTGTANTGTGTSGTTDTGTTGDGKATGIGTGTDAGRDGVLADTGTRGLLPVVLIGGLLLVGGLAATGVGVHLAHRRH